MGVFTGVMVIFFAIAPYMMHQLPYMLWVPFDPFESFSTYLTMYLLDVMAGWVTYVLFACDNGYIMLVLICLNYNYRLLGERAGHIGNQRTNRNGQPLETYEQAIALIKLHLKINR